MKAGEKFSALSRQHRTPELCSAEWISFFLCIKGQYVMVRYVLSLVMTNFISMWDAQLKVCLESGQRQQPKGMGSKKGLLHQLELGEDSSYFFFFFFPGYLLESCRMQSRKLTASLSLTQTVIPLKSCIIFEEAQGKQCFFFVC